jgi:hypothetical protein
MIDSIILRIQYLFPGTMHGRRHQDHQRNSSRSGGNDDRPSADSAFGYICIGRLVDDGIVYEAKGVLQ